MSKCHRKRCHWPLISFIFAVPLLPACTTEPVVRAAPPAPVVVAVPAQKSEPEDELVRYLSFLRSLSPAQLAEEVSKARSQGASTRNDLARLKSAAALLAVGAEEPEILALLEPLAQEKSELKVRSIAWLLALNVVERRRLKENLSTLQARSKDAQKAQEHVQSRNEQLRKQVEELERKLSEVKDIEKSLIKRR